MKSPRRRVGCERNRMCHKIISPGIRGELGEWLGNRSKEEDNDVWMNVHLETQSTPKWLSCQTIYISCKNLMESVLMQHIQKISENYSSGILIEVCLRADLARLNNDAHTEALLSAWSSNSLAKPSAQMGSPVAELLPITSDEYSPHWCFTTWIA